MLLCTITITLVAIAFTKRLLVCPATSLDMLTPSHMYNRLRIFILTQTGVLLLLLLLLLLFAHSSIHHLRWGSVYFSSEGRLFYHLIHWLHLPSTMALCQEDNTIIVVILMWMMSALSPSCRGCSPSSLSMSGYFIACYCCTRDCSVERENLQCCGEFVLTARSMWPIGVVHRSQSTGNMLIRQSDVITHANENLCWVIESCVVGTR